MKTNYGLLLALLTPTLITACNKSVQFAGHSADQTQAKVLFEQQFPAATLGSTTTKFKPVYGLVEEQVTLKEKAPVTTTMTQASRATVVDTATQGHDGSRGDDPFVVSAAGKLDMVVVIDDSSSMSTYQDLLKKGLSTFLSNLNGDWQIVVTTSTDSENCLVTDAGSGTTVIKSADYAKNPGATNAIFQNMVLQGSNGSGNERALYGARRALDFTAQNNDPNNNTTCKPVNWVRPGSAIAILTISDEDNCHNSQELNFHHTSVNKTDSNDPLFVSDFANTAHDGCDANEYNGTTLKNTLIGLGRTPGVDARFYGIFYRTADAENLCTLNTGADRNSGSNQGWAYDKLVADTNGASGSICDANYDATLKTMSQNVSRILKKQFVLTNVPIGSTLVVTIDGVPTTDFTLTGTTLTLNNPTGTQLKLEATYRHDATPKFERVKLSKKPAAGTLQAWFGNDKVKVAKMSYDDTAGDVLFMDQPPDDAVVKIQYLEDVVLPASFDVAKLPMAAPPMAVTVGGTATSDYTYDPVGRTLTFTAAPTDGAAVSVIYRMPNDQITTYESLALTGAAAIKSVTAADLVSHAAVPVAESGSNLVFDPADVVDGRQVVITYDYGDSASVLSHPLATTPLPGTVQVHVDDGSPDCIHGVTVKDSVVTFNCDAAKLGEVAISYQYVASSSTTFTLTQDVPAGALVKVFVDGQAITDAQVVGKTITVPASELKLTSTVHVIVSQVKGP